MSRILIARRRDSIRVSMRAEQDGLERLSRGLGNTVIGISQELDEAVHDALG